MIQNGKESVLSRWSRRKLEAEQAAPTEAPAVPGEIESEAAALPLEEAAQPVLTDADMPALDALTEDSDYSGFMSEGVSDELRNLALRKLFRAPVFNIRDGLDEYDEDYTSFEKLGDIVTADMKHRIEMQEKKLREKLAAEDAADVAEAELEALEDIDDEQEIDQPAETVAELDAAGDPDQESDYEQ